MMHDPNRSDPDSSGSGSDSIIDRLVDEIAAKLRAGEPVDQDEIVNRHPELADRLFRLLPALMILAEATPAHSPNKTGGHDGLEPIFVDADVYSSDSEGVTKSVPPTRSMIAPRVILKDPASDRLDESETLIRPLPQILPSPQRSSKLQLYGQIAQGGMGAILKGRDTELGRDVAVKVLLGKHRERTDLMFRFIEEAQIGGQLQHPGIVPVYELGTFPNGRPFFVMKLLKGRTFSTLLGDRAHNDLTRYLTIFESVCQTVAYAHSRGVIHRDLKPSNVMVGGFGEVQVMDWGLAKVLKRTNSDDDPKSEPRIETIIQTSKDLDAEEVSRSGGVLGTPAYMSPEQARGEIEDLDERCDVFALGSLLCQILTGEAAFTGESPSAIQHKAAEGDVREAYARLDASSATAAGDGGRLSPAPIDPELVALCKNCLAPRAEDRPRDAGELATRVTAYRAGERDRLRRAEIARAEQTARAEEATKRARVELERRRLTLALAAALAGLVALAALVWMSWLRHKADHMAATSRVVALAMDEAHQHLGRAREAPLDDISKWNEAVDAARQARLPLEHGVTDPALVARVDALIDLINSEREAAVKRNLEFERNREFLRKLTAVREANEGDPKHADIDYAELFRKFGLDPDRGELTSNAEILKKHDSPGQVALFLDDWARSRLEASKALGTTDTSWQRLIELAVLIDPHPWRKGVREMIKARELVSLQNLARDTELTPRTTRSLLVVAQGLIMNEDKTLAEEILKRAWRARPDNYWINYQLSHICADANDRARFATAATALRPVSELQSSQ